MSYNQYLFILLMAITCCLLYIAYLAWRKREFPIAVSLFFGMCAGAFYSFGYAFEIISSNLEQIRFWLKVEYIGISFGTFIWFIMVLQYTNHRKVLQKWIFSLLAIVPILTFISHYTNEWHHLFYSNMVIDKSEGFPLVLSTAGPFYMLHVFYSYILFFIGMGLLFRMYLKASVHMKKQVVLIMIGSCGPYGITLLYLSGILSTPIDISPFGFLFLGVFFIWGIYQFNMMKLVPHALKKVFESMKDAVIVLDLDNSISSFNHSAKKIFKELNDKKVIGRSAAQVFTPYPSMIEIITSRVSIEKKLKIINQKDHKYYQVSMTDVYDKKGKRVGSMLMLNDITDAVLTEEKLLTNSKQLSELNSFKDKMFTVIAHDIRDPLTILVSLMEILKDEMQDCGNMHDEITFEMEKQIQNTFILVESLLDWFRSQQGGMMFNPAIWNVSQAVKKNIGLLRIQSEQKRINITSDIQKDMIMYADKEMLDLIIRNLLSNAIKFTDYEGSIHINANQVEDKVIVSIADTGKGILPEQMYGLLQKPYPVSSIGTAGEKGIGLGLTLVKEFVQINGGEMWFESSPNLGSTFYFSTPTPTGRTEHSDGHAKRRSTG
ncbi:sensor histidine kinase [Lederbergia panacisoli]|uniref:sensor histidine kinase n=1 Tax=Lederbergia panacisoli TaxID=1255251 RepID=UPI00214B7210|nr:histidine kinase N-terminal 7TM domain-containing protein [Lederbergia panacisoli]MCR2823599.1 ATP-binding protein [Lederbergia panacisoli]